MPRCKGSSVHQASKVSLRLTLPEDRERDKERAETRSERIRVRVRGDKESERKRRDVVQILRDVHTFLLRGCESCYISFAALYFQGPSFECFFETLYNQRVEKARSNSGRIASIGPLEVNP